MVHMYPVNFLCVSSMVRWYGRHEADRMPLLLQLGVYLVEVVVTLPLEVLLCKRKVAQYVEFLRQHKVQNVAYIAAQPFELIKL